MIPESYYYKERGGINTNSEEEREWLLSAQGNYIVVSITSGEQTNVASEVKTSDRRMIITNIIRKKVAITRKIAQGGSRSR